MLINWQGLHLSRYCSLYAVSSLMIPLLEKELSELRLADISDTPSVPVIGRIEFTLSK